jgi:hypothetical protein
VQRFTLFIIEVLIVVGVSTWMVFKVALLVIEDWISKGERPWLRNIGHLEPAGRRQNGNPSLSI